MINSIPNIKTPCSVMLQVVESVKARRLELNLTQNALDATDDFIELFSKKQCTSIDDVVASTQVEIRKRGTRNE